MIELHWFTLFGIFIGAFALGIGTGFRIDRQWAEDLLERVAAAEASIAEIREERIANEGNDNG